MPLDQVGAETGTQLESIVESRCGAVASSDDHTPFPHPAHRTGQADFPHPALGQGLCNGDLPTPPSTYYDWRSQMITY